MVQIKIGNCFLIFAVIIASWLFFSFPPAVFAGQSSFNDTVNISIWSSGTPSQENKTLGRASSIFGAWKTIDDWNFYFYANYTNSSFAQINLSQGSGACTIAYNESSSFSTPVEMFYNAASALWWANQSFSLKGNLSYRTNCSSIYGNISLLDWFHVKNTDPYKVGSSVSFSAYEDNLTVYDFSKNVTDDDLNDLPLSFTLKNISSSQFNETSSSFYSWIFINTTGAIFSNANTSNHNGTYTLGMEVSELGGLPSYIFKFVDLTIVPVNDRPYFLNLTNKTLNMSTTRNPVLFSYLVQVIDEENNTPFTLNINFSNCSVAQWSNRINTTDNSTNCELFNITQWTFNNSTGLLNISFYPSRSDVGNFTINFSVTDLNNALEPKNASSSQVVTFRVLPINTEPEITYACENENTSIEDSSFSCLINASDIDESSALYYTANYSWFTFNDTNTNSSYGYFIQNSTINVSFLSYAVINFTLGDRQVGNWSINITVYDNGSYGDFAKLSSRVTHLSVDNVPDMPRLLSISNFTGNRSIYNSNPTVAYINASDDDLLIPGVSVYRENLSFFSNLSWAQISSCSAAECGSTAGTNRTIAKLVLSPSNSDLGNFTFAINVSDAMGNWSSLLLFVEVVNNSAPLWVNLTSNISANEGQRITLNLSENISHVDERQTVSFFYSAPGFLSFSLNRTTGVVNFTTNDSDVGQHWVNLTVSDGIANTSFLANFTIYNINDAPQILSLYGDNITVQGYQINTSEQVNITLWLLVRDNDLNISQKSFYNEILTVNTALTQNESNYSFINFSYAGLVGGDIAQYIATFTANRSQVGYYNLSINISDASFENTSSLYSLYIEKVERAPFFLSPPNEQNYSYSVFDNFSLQVIALDQDPGDFAVVNISNETVNGNFLFIDSSTGVISNASGATNLGLFNHAGVWRFKVTAIDLTNRTNSTYFTLTVYDYPRVTAPSEGAVFNLKENVSFNLSFSAVHAVQNNLTYTLSVFSAVEGSVRATASRAGDGSTVQIPLTPTFSDETICGANSTLRLNVSNALFSNVSSWQLAINHSNSPLVKLKDFGQDTNNTLESQSPYTLFLHDFFDDLDAYPYCQPQLISFTYNLTLINGSEINVSLVQWSNSYPNITFTSSSEAWANVVIRALEYNDSDNTTVISNLTSNTFVLHILRAVSTTPAPSTGGGGGGGSSDSEAESPEDTPFLLKLVLPAPSSVYAKEKYVLPIGLVNTGPFDLNNVSIYATVAKNGTIITDINVSFDRNIFSSIKKNQSENVSLTIMINTEEEGLYEILVNATVQQPKYSDWGKIYLHAKEGKKIEEKFIFIEELLVSNPECAEIKELVTRARQLFDEHKVDLAEQQLNEAIAACKQAIIQKPNPKERDIFSIFNLNLLGLLIIVFLFLGIVFYWLRRRAMKADFEYSTIKKV